MKFDRLKKSIIGSTLILMSVTNLIMPLSSNALDWGSNIGTSAGLGSPLLNEGSWQTEDWNQWEMIAFGNFLSNFPIPLVDDYMSAFQEGQGGSEGRGLKALQFGTGNDVQSTKILKNLLSYVLKVQSQSLTEIKVRYHKYDSTFTDSLGALNSDDGVNAKLKDLFIKMDEGNDTEPHISDIEKREIDATGIFGLDIPGSETVLNLKYAKEMVLPEFYIVTKGSGNKAKTVFDMSDSYDAQIFAVTLSRAASSKWKDEVNKNIEALGEQQIYLDVFGNICVVKNSKAVVVVPAAANQRLTKEKQYNFLTSTFLLDNYIHKTGNGLIESLMSADPNIGLSAKINYYSGTGLVRTSKDSDEIGKVIMYNDTDSAVFDYIKKKVQGGTDIDTAIDDFLANDYKDIHFGNTLYNMVNSGNTDENIQLPFKMEVMGSENETDWIDSIFGYGSAAESASIKQISQACQASNYISNWFPVNKENKVLNKIFTNGGEPSQLFKDRVYYSAGTQGDYSVIEYINYALKYLDTSTTHNISSGSFMVPSQQDFITKIKAASTRKQFNRAIFTSDGALSDEVLVKSDKAQGLYKHWLVNESGLKKGKEFTLDNIQNITLGDTFSDKFLAKLKTKLHMSGEVEYINNATFRIAGIYELNSAMQTASNILNVQEGTEFAAYTPWIYLTYLDWYGVMDGESKFDTELFNNGDIAAVNAEELFSGVVLTEDEKKSQITTYTYQLLDPESGKEYRKTLVNNFFTEWVYDNYKKIVFGTDTNSVNSKLSSSSSEGFLKLNTLSDNSFVSWLIDIYSANFIVIMGILLILTLVSGIIGGKGLGYIIQSLFTIACLMTLSPSMGDIAPYVCNKIVQGMFQENMTYWAIAEGVENNKIEMEYNGSDAESAEVNKFIRMLNITQLDKTIMIKNDISKKIVEDINGIDYGQLQKMQTTRWLFPVLMRQISADDGSADYVSVTLNDLYRNMNNMYWFYRNSATGGDKVKMDMTNNNTNTKTIADKVGIGESTGINKESDILSFSDKQSIYSGYMTSRGTTNTSSLDHHALSRAHGEDNVNVHTSFYLLNFGTRLTIPNPFDLDEIKSNTELTKNGYTEEVWDKYAEIIAKSKNANGTGALGFASNLESVTNDFIIPQISTYNSYDDPVYNCFGYMWATENLAPYFYTGIRDTFEADLSVGGLIYELQGYYAPILDSDGKVIVEDVHHTFMRDSRNGEIRDFLDMEEIFTNVIPYMYNVQVVAGGNNDNTGAFGETKLGDYYSIYADNKVSWLFQNNWVTKIVENRMFNQKDTIGYIDSSGEHQKAEIIGGLYPNNYSQYRSMVFSEAQMKDLGLDNSDLSYVELQIIKVNRQVEKDWTMLINFANTSGMKADVLYRQMSIDALMRFNKNFSGGNGISDNFSLYPTTLDLRNLSFDAVMKLLMISVNGNANGIYQDTMKTVIQNGDWFASILLLLDAIGCSTILPMLRDIGMAIVFLLMVYELFSGVITKKSNHTHIVIGTFLIYSKYIVATILFYGVFYLLITMSSPEQVLSATKIAQSSDHSTWFMFIMVLGDVVAYGVFVYKQIIKFAWLNRHDMGFDASMTMLSNLGSSIGGAVSGVGNIIHGTSRDTQSILKEKKNTDTGTVDSKRVKGNKYNDGDSAVEYSEKEGGKNNTNKKTHTDSGYASGKKVEQSKYGADEIDKKIAEGEKEYAKESKSKNEETSKEIKQ